MANNKAFAYNPTQEIVSGSINVGDLAIGFERQDYTVSPGGLTWWGGPDEDEGYVIAYPQYTNDHPTPIGLTWNPNKLGTNNTLSNNNQTITNTGANTSVLGTNYFTGPNKFMFTIRVNQAINGVIGIGNDDMNLESYVGSSDSKSAGFDSSGNFLYGGGIQVSSLPTWGVVNDIVDIAIDLVNKVAWIRVNEGNWNNNVSEDPATGNSSVSFGSGLINSYPAITPYPSSGTGEATFLDSPTTQVPDGFTFITKTFASVGFWGTKLSSNPFDDQTFVDLAQNVVNETFTSAIDASNWLWDNGYWNSYYSTVIVKLDASNAASYPGYGTDWFNLVGNFNNGTIVGTTYSAISGGTFYFNGTSDYVGIEQPISGGSSYSICAWIYSEDNNGSRNIVSSENSPFWISNRYLKAGVGAQFDLVVYDTEFPVNEWKFVSVTFDDPSDTMKLYVDGVLVDTNTGATQTYVVENTYIGSHYTTGFGNVSFFQGYIPKVYIFSTAQRADEILGLFNRTKSQYGL